MDYEIIEQRPIRLRHEGKGVNAAMVLREDGARQAYVSLPFRIEKYKTKKTTMRRLKDLFQPYEYVTLKLVVSKANLSETIKIKKKRLKKLLERLLKWPDYGYVYRFKSLFRKRHVGLMFSEPNTLYPVITEGAAIQQYCLYAGELKVGIWWD